MRKIIISLALVSFFLSLSFLQVTYAACGMPHAKAEAEKGEIINTVCPVMGRPVDQNAPYKLAYKGKTIGFCCDTCERPGMHGTERWFCATCTSDICFECVSRDGVAALRLDAWPADERAAHVSQSQLLVEEGRLLAPLFDRLGRMYVLLKKC